MAAQSYVPRMLVVNLTGSSVLLLQKENAVMPVDAVALRSRGEGGRAVRAVRQKAHRPRVASACASANGYVIRTR